MTSPSPVWVRLIDAIEPTALDPNRYAAGSTWHMPAARAAELVAAEVAEYCDPPAAVTRVVTEPLEPPPQRVRFLSTVPAVGRVQGFASGTEHEMPHAQAVAFVMAGVAEFAVDVEPIQESIQPTHAEFVVAAEEE